MICRMTDPVRFLSRLFPVLLALLLAAPAPLLAGSDDPFDPDKVAQIDMLPGWRMADGRHMTALRIRLAEGWKTYWRAPGDTGIPPDFDWSGSRNLAGVEPLWPVPVAFDTAGALTLGYWDELILPLAVTPAQAGEAIVIEGQALLGICSDVCLPMEASFGVTLPATEAAAEGEGKEAALIRRWLERGPISGAEAGLGEVACVVEPISDGLRVTARLTLPRLGAKEIGVIEPADRRIWVSPTELRRRGDRLTLVAELVAPSAKPFALDQADIRLTVFAGERGVDIGSCAGS